MHGLGAVTNSVEPDDTASWKLVSNMSIAASTEVQPEIEYLDVPMQSVRYLEHGYPSRQIRWHCHDRYELHHIVESDGSVFVGDYVGGFEKGHTVLTGPHLAHNWVSDARFYDAIELRDQVVQFDRSAIQEMANVIPEFTEYLPLLDRAQYGIEFQGKAQEMAGEFMLRIGKSEGVARVSLLIDLLQILSQETQYTLLNKVSHSTSQIDHKFDRISKADEFVMANFNSVITLSQVAELVGMNECAFSRYYKRATGRGFCQFVSHVRINKACELLVNTDAQITDICFESGFNNVANFNRQFLREKNTTPREYRMRLRDRT